MVAEQPATLNRCDVAKFGAQAMADSAAPKSTGSKKARKIAAAKRALDDALNEAARGRPTAYRPEYAPRATGLCMLGLTNAELGERFGVSEGTIERWIKEHDDFRGCVYDGREGMVDKVVAAAFKAATGFEHPEDDIRTVSLGDGVSEVRITPTTKRYPPNYNFANLILINRARRHFPHRESDNAASGERSPADIARAARESIRAALSEVGDAPAQPDDDSKEQQS